MDKEAEREWALQHGQFWVALMEALVNLHKSTKDEWPLEWESLHGQALLDAILASETKASPGVDAAIRVIARRQLTPRLSPIEAWHLRHRFKLGIETCAVAMDEKLRFPDMEAEEDYVEGLLIRGWDDALRQRWRDTMVLRLKELLEFESKNPPKG